VSFVSKLGSVDGCGGGDSSHPRWCRAGMEPPRARGAGECPAGRIQTGPAARAQPSPRPRLDRAASQESRVGAAVKPHHTRPLRVCNRPDSFSRDVVPIARRGTAHAAWLWPSASGNANARHSLHAQGTSRRLSRRLDRVAAVALDGLADREEVREGHAPGMQQIGVKAKRWSARRDGPGRDEVFGAAQRAWRATGYSLD